MFKLYSQITKKDGLSAILRFTQLILKPLRYVLAPHASQRIANLTQRDVVLHTFNEERHQVLGAFRSNY